MLELKNVSKSYHGVPAVDDVSFTLDEGQILGMVGANGAGKSTCVSMISTLIRPDSGVILFDGQDIFKDPSRIRSAMGYVPQDIALYESLSGKDNMLFWGKSYKVSGARLKDEIKRVCEIISFDDRLLKKKVSEYSGGMKRRLNIGVALLHRPRLVILDEPTTGIDLQSGNMILDAIEQLRRDGTAVLYVGHYMEEVERISTHLCVMDRGKCKAFGPKEELLKGENGRISLADFMAMSEGVTERGKV